MISTEIQGLQKDSSTQKGRTLNECFHFLESIKQIAYEHDAPERVRLLEQALQNPSQKLDIILVGGSNNKNSTIFFSSKLLQEEGFKVGTVYANHILSYAERIFINDEPIQNKLLTDTLNSVINAAVKNSIEATAFEIMLVTSLVIFQKEGINTAVIEVGIGGKLDATAVLRPLICAITKVTPKDAGILGKDLDNVAYEMMGVCTPGSWCISAEQSKLKLQKMKAFAEGNSYQWSMPIRKLSPLPYIYEQLFGKEASMAERIAQLYVENIKGNFSPFLRGNLLATQKGQRGRPTLEAKRNSELNPLKTIKSFWLQNFELKRGVFEILDKERPTVLLDQASDVDAFSSLFLGLRLFHYKKPINGICMIMGLALDVEAEEVLKLARYLFKKVYGDIYFVPLQDKPSHSPEKLANLAKSMGIRAFAFKGLKEAFDQGQKVVDHRDGVLCITGEIELISNYWKQVRDIKKF